MLEYEEFVYYMMNKPQGIISATEDPKHRTVLDLLDDIARSKEVFPVGRLDIDTHGLLLLTNDGQLAHALLSPKRHVDKTYLAQVKGIMIQEDVETFANGIPLKDFTCQPAKTGDCVHRYRKKSKPNPCDHCRTGSFIRSSVWWATVAGSGGLATFDYGNSSIG